jgi:1-acyl-sn-glycerol-3-phosphate acyltransferase
MHGHLYIILKESLKYIPVIGWGMRLYGFIFLSRKWATDKDRFQHRLRKLTTSHSGPLSGSSSSPKAQTLAQTVENRAKSGQQRIRWMISGMRCCQEALACCFA